MKTFVTWKYKGVRFIAVSNGENVVVMDENGGAYGSWLTTARFRQVQQQEGVLALAFTNSKATLLVKVENTQ